jgi:hypothetical protein
MKVLGLSTLKFHPMALTAPKSSNQGSLSKRPIHP